VALGPFLSNVLMLLAAGVFRLPYVPIKALSVKWERQPSVLLRKSYSARVYTQVVGAHQPSQTTNSTLLPPHPTNRHSLLSFFCLYATQGLLHGLVYACICA
jgi:hypothetical protein